MARGHQVKVFVLTWNGEIPSGIDVTVVPVTALFNHNKHHRYTEWIQAVLARDPVDGVVGFNKMPGLDVYYAADSCFEEKARTQRGPHYKLLPRYKHFSAYERAVFGTHSNTEIMIISEAQKPFFEKHYRTQPERMHLLPPGISKDRIAPDNAADIRAARRAESGLGDNDKLVLFVGSGFIKKGLKRAIYAVDSLPGHLKERTRVLVIGEDKPGAFLRLIKRLKLEDVISFIGGSNDVPAFLLAGDLLLHPASDENAGMVLLEAMVAGLPVLATDVCGYGHYVVEADMGHLVESPFRQTALNEKLRQMLEHDDREKWIRNGRDFARTADIYSLPQKAADVIEHVIGQRCASPGQS
ncbi:MAG: glycosyltransferase family 4 protein [Gammaproteobacteria bacterium]|nr:glycosyltransferase family 4 protein [Gammaproteobacteria bacterium]